MKKMKMKSVFLALIMIVSLLTSSVSAIAKGITSKAGGTATITAILFEDIDTNGQQEPNEPGISGITVRLLNDSGTEIARTTTDGQGRYTFDKLSSDIYRIKVDYPVGYARITNGPVGFTSDGLTGFIELEEGETYTDAWVGFQSTDASIKGTVFNDENKSGEKDTTEKGIAGIELGLYVVGSATPVQTVKTDANGNYSFAKITPDKIYEIKPISMPSQYEIIKNNNFDENGKSIQFALKPLDKKNNINLALYETIPVTEINVEPKELIQYVGDTGKLTVTITPNNATDKEVTYTSEDPSIMTIDKNGNWEAKAVGTTNITVRTKNGKTAIVKVTVRERAVYPEEIIVEPTVLDQFVGDTGKLKVTFQPSNTTVKDVTFTSADPSIITVDKDGNWEAKNIGKTIIIVTTSNGKTAIVQVTVKAKEIPVDDITIEPSVLDQYVGDKGTLKVTITPNNATNKNVIFTSANTEIITVDKDGNWVAKAVGKTTITVTTSNGKTAIVQVTVRKREGVGATFYDYPRYLGYFKEIGTGTAKNFDDDYNNVEPYPGLGTDYYKVKKVGYVTLKDTGIYTFSIEVDDNGAVYIDDEKIIDRDNITGGTLSNFRYLKAGQTIKITTEHYNKEAPVSYFHLRWQTPSNPYSPKAIPDSEITME